MMKRSAQPLKTAIISKALTAALETIEQLNLLLAQEIGLRISELG